MKKLIGVVYGGYSGEAVISRKSAEMILNNIDRTIYDAVGISMDRKGFTAISEGVTTEVDLNDFSFELNGTRKKPDLCFIIIHGAPGEDGKLQGYFDLIGMPYTTGSVLNTALTFNKAFTNEILKKLGYNSAKGRLISTSDSKTLDEIRAEFEFPLIVKPNEGGSSLGISLVKESEDLEKAVHLALEHDQAALIEEYIEGGEFSCGVIGTKDGIIPLAVTEIKTQKAFFDYSAKYEYDQTEEVTPAPLPNHLYEKCQMITTEIYDAFNCRGVIRIDYRLRNEEFFVIEINSIPGMSEKSIVPQQAAELGISKTELINMIIDSAQT